MTVLSLDLADPISGDLADPQALATWVARILAGKVRGVLGGPPCETWSAARTPRDAEGQEPQRDQTL